jgi:hypothetical protein
LKAQTKVNKCTCTSSGKHSLTKEHGKRNKIQAYNTHKIEKRVGGSGKFLFFQKRQSTNVSYKTVTKIAPKTTIYKKRRSNTNTMKTVKHEIDL